jgi:ferrous iron transport protein B
MGTVILFASIVVWALGYFPRHDAEADRYKAKAVLVQRDTTLPAARRDSLATLCLTDAETSRVQHSLLGRLGRAMEPVVRPLGFDWKMGVSLLAGLSAKEIVVSTMGVLYHAGSGTDENSQSLIHNLQRQTHGSGPHAGQRVITPLVALSFMLFILLYVPCIATLATISREAGWRWMLFEAVYTVAVAWLVAFAVYQTGSLIV